MKQRILGKSGLKVSAIGLGCMSMSPGLYGQPDEKEAIKTLHKAHEHGITMFDTADMYGVGHNEEFIKKVLKPIRDKIVISTKCGIVCNQSGISRNGSKQYIKSACEASLKRLETDRIDVYYLHRLDPVIDVEESMAAMQELHQEGKILHVGLSEIDADIIKRAEKIFPLTAVQSEYSILFRKEAESVLPICKELNIAFVPFSPLCRGFLSGQINSTVNMELDDFRRSLPYLKDENIQNNLQLVNSIKEIAASKHNTPCQIALAWLLAQDPQIIPIPGTTKVKHLEENIEAVDIQLNTDELNQIDEMCNQLPLQGKRYPTELQGWFVD